MIFSFTFFNRSIRFKIGSKNYVLNMDEEVLSSNPAGVTNQMNNPLIINKI